MVLLSIARLLVKSLLAASLVSVVLAAASLSLLRLTDHKLLAVQTGSMVPTFRPGDALIVRPVSSKTIRPGQIISYHSTRDTKIIISHRLVKIDKRTGWLTTAGDAIHHDDPSFPPKFMIGQVICLLPDYGRVNGFLHSWKGLLLTIYIPASLTTAYEIWRLYRIYASPMYSVRL